MADAAHVGSFEHEVFSKPIKVNPPVETRETPDNYRRFPGGDELPDQMKIWLVQKTDKKYGSVVARSYGFTDSPDAEALVLGFNRGKEYGAVGIGRHGNFLQWGYWAPPSKMTEDGKKLFINCICYIHKFNGKAQLVRRTNSQRMNALRLADVINRISGDQHEFFVGTFPPELEEKYGKDPAGLVRYYKENLEFIYRDDQFQVDEELKSLGLESNRKIETLEKLIALLKDDSKANTPRLLLNRYTNQSFQNPDQWQSWFDNNKDRIYFTDVGGYKFLVIPEGYLDTK